MTLRRRGVLVLLVLLLGSLVALQTASVAQSSGSQLVEAVSSEAAGDQAYVALESVDAFSVDGARPSSSRELLLKKPLPTTRPTSRRTDLSG